VQGLSARVVSICERAYGAALIGDICQYQFPDCRRTVDLGHIAFRRGFREATALAILYDWSLRDQKYAFRFGIWGIRSVSSEGDVAFCACRNAYCHPTDRFQPQQVYAHEGST